MQRRNDNFAAATTDHHHRFGDVIKPIGSHRQLEFGLGMARQGSLGDQLNTRPRLAYPRNAVKGRQVFPEVKSRPALDQTGSGVRWFGYGP
jgi:hypothetical protein